jgi:hypothetical protein
MRMRHLTMAAVVAAGALGLAGNASAAPVIFFAEDPNTGPDSTVASHPLSDAAQASFLSNLTSATVYNFDSLSADINTPATVTGTFGSVGFTLTGGAVASSLNGDNAGRFAISPNNYYDTSTQDFSLVFGSAVAAFGFYGTDISDAGGTLTVKLFQGANETDEVINAVTGLDGDGSVLYWGFYDADPLAAYTKITFSNSNASDGFGFDDFTVGSLAQVNPNPNGPGTGVPEPLTLSLFGAGLAGAVAIGRRRKTKV